jgi:endonuclease G
MFELWFNVPPHSNPDLPAPPQQPMLVEAANPKRYQDSTGYDPYFLGSHYQVPLPRLHPDLQSDIAHLKSGETVLNYAHFSIVMSKSRRLAFYTAVNIDGSQLVDVPRAHDKWFLDPRLDRDYQSDAELYVDNQLDRGHLTRRKDPAWGVLAKTANDDTFHFTNCVPQHKNFNQGPWRDLENYLLIHARQFNLKVTVFTGPLFRSDDRLYRGYRIPAEFWKVAVLIKSNTQLSATAYLQTQKNLLCDLDFHFGFSKCQTYQVPLSTIELLSQLDFGDLRQYDPLLRTNYFSGQTIEGPEDIRI